jgi:DNA mismatch repair protein MutS2
MKQLSAELLEYPALKALVGRYLSSDGARLLLDALEPSNDREALEAALAEVREGLQYLDSSQPAVRDLRTPGQKGGTTRPRFDSLPYIATHLAKLGIEGAVLEPRELLETFTVMERATELRSILTASGGRFPRLGERAFRLGDFKEILRDLGGRILPDGSLDDKASVALHRIRRDMDRQKRSIQDSLERFIKAHKEDGILQEDFIAIRNDRFVVPVAAGQRRRVDGVIHASSGSGQTMFMEPLETIGLNNDLVRLREEEMREVFRILKEMSDRLRDWRPVILATVEELAALEFVFAKATFAREFHCTVPRFGEQLALVNARHPLLEDVLKRQRKAVVPITLTLAGADRTLLISGPNTGGKTVTLKTVGLLALMAQSGLPVPAESAEFPLFENVLADLGDHQSIEQSLSSFSSHITRVREILLEVTSDSLVLLDELGRATDPEEGGALAVAALEQIRGWRPFILASTHLTAPKVYGATTEGVVNAAMSFDEATLAPTYHLRVGVPGASAGLAIAERLGLPPHLIAQARAKMSHQQQDLSRLLQLLETRLEEASVREVELRKQRDALAVETAHVSKFWEKQETAKLAELERRNDALIEEFRKRTNETLDRLMEQGQSKINEQAQRKLAESAQRKVAQVRREIGEQFVAVVKGESPVTKADFALAVGMRVKVSGVTQPARIKRLINADRIEVEAGFLKMQIAPGDILEVLPDNAPATQKRLPANVTFRGDEGKQAQRELNVIGHRAEEALDAVEKFLDQAALASLDRVRIVHGHGMGVLKRAIAEMLKGHPLVARHMEAQQVEGGAGATIVEMRL